MLNLHGLNDKSFPHATHPKLPPIISLKKKIRYHKHMENTVFEEIKTNLVGWIKGQIIMSLLVGVLAGVAFYFLGLPYFLPLALFVALLNLVPYVGSVVGFLPAFILAATISMQTLIFVVLAFITVQVLESYVFQPLIMKKTLGLNPFLTIVSVIIGQLIFGPVGAILAVPVVSVILVLRKNMAKTETEQNKNRAQE